MAYIPKKRADNSLHLFYANKCWYYSLSSGQKNCNICGVPCPFLASTSSSIFFLSGWFQFLGFTIYILSKQRVYTSWKTKVKYPETKIFWILKNSCANYLKRKKKNPLKLNSICLLWAFKQKRRVNQISAVTSGSAMIIHTQVNPYKESQGKMWFKVLGLLFRDSEFPPSTPNKVHEPMCAPLSHHKNQCKSSVTQTLNLISEIQRGSKFTFYE